MIRTQPAITRRSIFTVLFALLFALPLTSWAGQRCASSNMTGHSNAWLPSTYGPDRRFHSGKRAFLGRKNGAKEKLEFCILREGQVEKISHRKMRQFRGESVTILAFSLVDCQAPQRLALAKIDREKVPDVLYYLNSKYRLSLEAPDPSLLPTRTMVAAKDSGEAAPMGPAGE